MTRNELDEAWLLNWAGEVSTAVGELMRAFEARFGFEPDRNEVRLATGEDREAGRLLNREPVAARDLGPLYRIIGEVSLPDVGNGLFLQAAQDTLGQFSSEGAVLLPQSDDRYGIVIASNGGGQLYVADSAGVIYRSRVASVHSELDPIADGLQDFLELLHQDVQRFASTGQIGVL